MGPILYMYCVMVHLWLFERVGKVLGDGLGGVPEEVDCNFNLNLSGVFLILACEY